MNEDRIARELLSSKDTIIAIPLTLNGDIQCVDKIAEHYASNTFDVTASYKFIQPIHIDNSQAINELTGIWNGFGFIFTNWHLENQEMERKEGSDYVVWDGNVIYTDELIKAGVVDINYAEKLKHSINPFEVQKSMDGAMFYTPHKTLEVKANLQFIVGNVVAEVVLPNLKEIYYVPRRYIER